MSFIDFTDVLINEFTPKEDRRRALNEAYVPKNGADDWKAAERFKSVLDNYELIDLDAFHAGYDRALEAEGLLGLFADDGKLTARNTYGTIKNGLEAATPGTLRRKLYSALKKLWVAQYSDGRQTVAEIGGVLPAKTKKEALLTEQQLTEMLPEILTKVNQANLQKLRSLVPTPDFLQIKAEKRSNNSNYWDSQDEYWRKKNTIKYILMVTFKCDDKSDLYKKAMDAEFDAKAADYRDKEKNYYPVQQIRDRKFIERVRSWENPAIYISPDITDIAELAKKFDELILAGIDVIENEWPQIDAKTEMKANDRAVANRFFAEWPELKNGGIDEYYYEADGSYYRVRVSNHYTATDPHDIYWHSFSKATIDCRDALSDKKIDYLPENAVLCGAVAKRESAGRCWGSVDGWYSFFSGIPANIKKKIGFPDEREYSEQSPFQSYTVLSETQARDCNKNNNGRFLFGQNIDCWVLYEYLRDSSD